MKDKKSKKEKTSSSKFKERQNKFFAKMHELKGERFLVISVDEMGKILYRDKDVTKTKKFGFED